MTGPESRDPVHFAQDGSAVKLHVLSVLVNDKAGVLARVSSLFARRAYNIHSLAVAPTEETGRSRITVVVDVESTPLEQITKQLFKLIDVIKISELDPAEATQRELMILTIKADASTRGQIIELVNVYEGGVLDVGHNAISVSVAGTPGQIHDFTELVQPFGIVDMQRTGRIALPKLAKTAPRISSVRKAG